MDGIVFRPESVYSRSGNEARSIYKLNKLVCSCDNVSGTSTRQQSRGSLLSSASILSVTSQQTPGHFLLTCLGGGRHVE